MIQIDARVPKEVVEQFASQTQFLAPLLRHQLTELFGGDVSPEFLEGIIAGMRWAYQVAPLREGQELMGAALAVTAQQLLQANNENNQIHR